MYAGFTGTGYRAYLQVIDLLVCEAALVGAVCNPEAVAGLACLLVRELVDELHLLDQVACMEVTRFQY